MKRSLFFLTFLITFVTLIHADVKYSKRYNKLTNTWASYPEVTIHDIQYNQLDSLLMAETIQTTNPARWTLQMSDRVETATTSDDTVTITALCVIPPKMIGYTAFGYTMVVYDTGVGNAPWSGIIVRANLSTSSGTDVDSTIHIADGFLAVERGDIIKMTGVLSEFPTNAMNSLTQFQPIPGISIDILNPLEKAPVPPPIVLNDNAELFYDGTYTDAGPYHVQYSTAEQYEGMYVQFTNLTVTRHFNVGARQQFEMIDDQGNTVSGHDASRWFTAGGAWRDSTSVWALPPVFSVIDTIRGIVLQISGGGANHGYLVAPMYQENPLTGNSDVQFGVAKPTIANHSRIPNVIPAETNFEIRARATQTAGGYPVDSVFCMMSVNYGPFEKTRMEIVDTGNIYGASYLDLPAGTFVRYFIEAVDTGNQRSRLAYQGVGVLGTDTALGFFNFTVLSGDVTIRDIQYTPYNHGVSPYYGGTATLRGIVTADSSDMVVTPHSSIYGTGAYYLQSGTQPWSGIWLVAGVGDTSLAKIRRGDSISVTGTVGELNSVTQLYNIVNTVSVISSSNTPPSPITLPTSTLTTGNPAAEQYEGMLVRLVGSKVTNLAPIFSNQSLYEIDDGSGGVIIDHDGKNTYTNSAGDSLTGSTSILYLNDPIDTLTGIVYFSGGNRYALCPRTDADFVAGHHVDYDQGWNIVSIGRDQTPAATGYNVTKLFPSAVSNPFKFAGAYVADTAIWPGIGYWLKFPSAKTFRQLGAPRQTETIGVVAGWNLVGMIGDSIEASSVTAQPDGNTLSSFFGYKSGYTIASMLKPTKGYWVKATMDGSITMVNSGFAKSSRELADLSKFNTVTIVGENGFSQSLYFGQDAEGTVNLAAYEMPPVSPAGMTDARYVSGRLLETYPAEFQSQKEFGIALRGVEGSVMVQWNIVSADNKRFTITDATGNNPVALSGKGEVKIIKAPEALKLNVMNGGEMPKEFSLSQNYPNPFNPSTQFTIALPVAAHLEVGVYNILGQKVATLANDVREAGYHTLVWNSTTDAGVLASSGVYFVKMNSGTFNSVRKIVLMK